MALPVVLISVNHTAGPPDVFALPIATVQFYAHRKGARVAAGGALFEVKLNEAAWSQDEGVMCEPQGLCNFSLPSAAVMVYKLQVRAVNATSRLPGPPASWRWDVRECSEQQYAVISVDGALTCKLCPPGGNCGPKGTVLRTVSPLRGWWGQQLSEWGEAPPSDPELFFECPLPGSCLGGYTNGSATCNTSEGFASGSLLCGSCIEGRVRYRDECVKCPHTAMGAVVTLGLFLLLVCGVYMLTMIEDGSTYFTDDVEERAVVKKIVVTYLVTLSSVGDFKARGPALLRDMMGWARPVGGGMRYYLYAFHVSYILRVLSVRKKVVLVNSEIMV